MPEEDRGSRLLATVAVLCAVVITGVVIRREFFPPPPPLAPLGRDIEVDNWESYLRDGHHVGNPGAPVTLIVFSDYECPFCRQFATKTWPALAGEFGERIALVWRHWPLTTHENAYLAARASECAAHQGQFVNYNDLLFRTGADFSVEGLSEAAVGAEIGDMETFDACVRRVDPVPEVESGIADAKKLGLQGTPSVLINGTLMGSASLDRLRRRVAKIISGE